MNKNRKMNKPNEKFCILCVSSVISTIIGDTGVALFEVLWLAWVEILSTLLPRVSNTSSVFCNKKKNLQTLSI